MKTKNKIIISLAIAALMIFINASSVSATESNWQNINSSIESGLTGSVHNCSPLTVTNGSVAAYPTCTITCNSGYLKSGNTCVVNNSGGGSSSSGASTPLTTPISTVVSSSNVILGCGERSTGFSMTTGVSCIGNTGSTSFTNSQVIPGCDNRTTGFSSTTGRSCVGNIGTGISQPTTPTTPTVTNPGSTKFVFTLLLKLGSKGNEVKELQKILIAGGYLVGTADGSFGPKTVVAVKKYQTANGLKADGIVGKAVRSLLNK